MFSFLFFIFFHGYNCQRRIEEGIDINKTVDKNYVVYLLKAAQSTQNYDSWLCGGAIVSKDYIVTSAACVTDVQHLYAIAGYRKYTKEMKIYEDPCTNEKKKKIVLICTPKPYDLVYGQPAIWTNIDIAVVQVESPYDFADDSYNTVCSYMPGKIDINYESKYQSPGIDAIVLGWGHTTDYRQEKTLTDLNQPELQYAPTLIQDKEECKRAYEIYPGMDVVIEKYMICTMEKGNLDDVGKPILKAEPTADGCNPMDNKLRLHGRGVYSDNADVPDDEIVLIENSRKDIKLTNFSKNDFDQNSHNSSLINKMDKTVLYSKTANGTRRNKICKLKNAKDKRFLKGNSRKDTNFLRNDSDETVSNSRRSNTRRSGICQNDHGGPLVTWIGGHQMLIGVASAFKITSERTCAGPYLYTSTQCNGLFLHCVTTDDPSTTDTRRTEERRKICSNLLNEQGFQLVEKHISWLDHPDGPAVNEKNGTTQLKGHPDGPAVDETNGTKHVSALKDHPDGPAVNEKNGTTPVCTLKGHPDGPAVDEKNGTTHVLALKDHPDGPAVDEKNGTTHVLALKDHPDGPAVDEKNGTTHVSALKDHPDGPAVDEKNGTTHVLALKDHPDGPAVNEKNGTTQLKGHPDGPAVDEKNGTTHVSALKDHPDGPAVNEKNGTTHVSALKDHPDGPAVNEKNGTTHVSAVNTDTNRTTVS